MATLRDLRKAISGSMPDQTPALNIDNPLDTLRRMNEERERIKKEEEQRREQARINEAFSQMSNENKLGLIQDNIAERESVYQDLLYKYQHQYGVGNTDVIKSNSDIRETAERISPYYKKYQFDPSKLTLGSNDWANIQAHYDAYKEAYGEDQANSYLNNIIKDNIASNQAWYEQAWNGFRGMGASTFGAIAGLVGNIKGVYDYLAGNHEDIEGMNGWNNFLDSVMDNDWTRYAKDVVEYGTWLPEGIEKAKSYGTDFSPHGLSELEIIQSQDQENSLFSSATPWMALQSGGFTVASMFIGAGEAKVASWLFGSAMKGAAWVNKVSQSSKFMANTLGRTVRTAEQLDKTLQVLKRGENIVNRYVIPGSVGSMEGAVEGLQTKMQIEEEQGKYLDDYYNARVNEVVQQKLADPNNTKTEEELFRESWDELSDEYMQSKDQIEYAAAMAGINNFYINSFVNGAINSTLKAGLQSDRVQNALRNGRLTGWAFNRPRWNITGAGTSEATARAVAPWGGKAWNLIKEPLSEAAEEYIQTLSNDINVGAAENNIHQFIENKFSGDGTAVVGDWFGSDWAAAWTALKGSAVSKEAQQSAIMGALSSVMGTPVMPGRRRVVNQQTGEIETQSIFNLSNLARGVNEQGQRESTWEYIQRITPWRSGMYSNYQNFLRDRDKDEKDAQALTAWLRDPKNMDKFNGVTGTVAWAMEMEKSATTNDEFGYRNSALGKIINDAIMLQKIADSNLGQSLIQQLEEVADMSADSPEAQAYINHMKNNVNVDTEGKTDEQILEQLQKNAQKMRSTIATVNSESEKIDRLIGNVDDDTRQSLIYGQMMLDDWRERLPQLNDEIRRIQIQASVGMSSSTYSDQEKKLIAKHGSLKAAINNMHKLNERRVELEKQIDTIDKLGDNATVGERTALKIAKAQVKQIGKQLKEYDSLSEYAQDNIILNEQEIMSLDTATRGRMLRLGAQKLYTSLHEDKEAVDRLTTQIDQLEKQRDREKAKPTKGKKANRKKANKVKKLNAEINQLRKELKEHKGETRQFYSDEQQAVIDNLVQQGMAQDANFLDKVVDAGRMQAAIETFYAQRQAILTDPNAYQNYVRAAKRNAQLERVRMRAEHIGNIENYTEFADEMDRVLSNSSFQEKDLIMRTLRDNDNENWNRYKQKREDAESLVDQLTNDEMSSSLTANDISMFMHSLNYLQNKDVDLTDINQVISALTEETESGDFAFRDYVERMNDSHPEQTRTVFTSIGSVIQTYKEAMQHKLKHDDETEQIEREVTVEDTETTEDVPPIADTPIDPFDLTPTTAQPKSIWDVAYSSPEGGQVDDEGHRLDTQKPFEAAGSKEIANMAEIAVDIINSSSYFQEIKEATLQQFMTLSNAETYHYETVDDLIDAINSLSNTIKSMAEESNDNEAISALLDRVANALTRQNTALAQTGGTQQAGPQVNPNAATMSTVDIDFIRKNYPDSWVARVYEQYSIDDFIRSHTFNINTQIYFVTDSSLTTQCMSEMQDRYRNSMKPILAVVESENGPIEIDGKKYQPIGVMPSTGARTTGSNRLTLVRELSSTDEGINLVRNRDGSPVVTRARGYKGAVRASHPDQNRENGAANNRPVQQLIVETLPREEQQRLNAMPHSDRIKDPAYKNAKANFIAGLLVQNTSGTPTLYFKPNNLKDGGGSPSIIITKDVGTTLGINGMTLQQADQSSNPDDLIEFNSRTSRLYHEVLTTAQSLIPNLNSESDPSEFTSAAEKIASILNSKVGSFVYLGKAGYSFNVSFDMERAQQTGEIAFNVTMDSTDESRPQIQMGSISKTSDIKAFGKQFISNLLMSNGAINDFVKWQVNYGDVRILKGEQVGNRDMASKNISMLIDDGIFDIAASSLQYMPSSIQMESPFDNDNNPRNFPAIVANADNATNTDLGARPTVTPVTTTPNGATVDPNTGLPIEGTPTQQSNPALENARRISNAIVRDSKRIKLSSDNRYYELFDDNGNVVKRFARVTSLIQADEHGESFDENSPWITPSTNIGTGFDTLVRDFFNGEFYRLDNTWCSRRSTSEATEIFLDRIYPNATTEQIGKFLDQLEQFKNSLDAKGITIVSNDVTVTGTVTVTDDKGQQHKIPIAGTLDLFGYDAHGNFFVFDMKTIHNSNTQKLLQRKSKWARQVSLYKDLLEQSYGIRVSEDNLKIIPIDVRYPDPVGTRGGTADYSVVPSSNQLMIDGREFRDAQPRMLGTTYEGQIPLPYTPLNIKWDKLSDREKAVIEAEMRGANPVRVESGGGIERQAFEDPDLSELDDLPPVAGDNELTPPNIPASDNLDYSKFTAEQKRMLRKKGIKNSKDWNNLTSEEQQSYLGCL